MVHKCSEGRISRDLTTKKKFWANNIFLYTPTSDMQNPCLLLNNLFPSEGR